MRRLIAITVLLAGCATAPPPATAPPVLQSDTTTERASGSVRVSASSLNVRAEASSTAAIVTKVRRGTKLDVLGEEKGWIRVRLASGESGWVSAQHVSRDAPARRRKGCTPDSDYSFAKTPVPTFSDSGAHGLVVVEATVDSKGNVMSTKVISNSTGDEALAFLTEREIKAARFIAPVRDCATRSFIFTYKRSF
ncbi:MAG: SH3 domain-containing protein [Thermoanaerobaculia bacterium]|nr:SH3 domain-containing protein [Thermoanaerobaculia bacterium]